MREVVGNAVGGKFSLDLFVRATRTVSLGVTALDHKVFDYAVEGQPVIKSLSDKLLEVCHSFGCDIGIELHNDIAEFFYLNEDAKQCLN